MGLGEGGRKRAATMRYLVGLPSYKNLGEALEGVLARHLAPQRKRQAEKARATPTPTSPASPLPHLLPKSVALSQAKREERLAQYQQVVALREQGFSQTAIASQVGIGHATVSRWLSNGTFASTTIAPAKDPARSSPQISCREVGSWLSQQRAVASGTGRRRLHPHLSQRLQATRSLPSRRQEEVRIFQPASTLPCARTRSGVSLASSRLQTSWPRTKKR